MHDEQESKLDFEQTIQDLKMENEKLKSQLLESLADFDNLRKRSAREKEETLKYAVKKFALEVINIGDDLDRALAFSAEANPLKEGVQMVSKNLAKILGNFGIRKFESLDKAVDGNFHEVVERQDLGTEKSGKIVKVLQDGYMIHENLLRPALVVVGL